MSLEQSMKAAVETLQQLEQLKAEVVELTATRDSLRDITATLDKAQDEWLKLVSKTTALREQVDGEVAKKRQQASDDASRLIENARMTAESESARLMAIAAQEVEASKAELATLTAAVQAAKDELASLNTSIEEATGQLDRVNYAIATAKKAVAAL